MLRSALLRITISIFVLVLLAGGFFYLSNKVNFSKGSASQTKTLEIGSGDSIVEIGKKLEKDGLISNSYYFVYYMWSKGLRNRIIAGEYEINSDLTIPEVARIVSRIGEVIPDQKKLTFPEGWTAKKMSERLNAKGLPGSKFLSLKDDTGYFREKYGYEFLQSVPDNKGLEGFLFPDTYFFYDDTDAEQIIKKMLDNFDAKISDDFKREMRMQEKNIYEIITMASVIENEVKSEKDRKIVSDIFWGRIEIGQPLESCATLAYILGVNKKQYSFEDTRIQSPYNTYLTRGLPPGPISNPSLISIKAAIYPTKTNFNYFLSSPKTGTTVFSKNIDEHNASKLKHGL